MWTSAAVVVLASLSIAEQLLQGKTGFPSCGCHSPVRDVTRRQLGRHWCMDSGTQTYPLCLDGEGLASTLVAITATHSTEGNTDPPPCPGCCRLGWGRQQASPPTAAHSAISADIPQDSKAACVGTSITAVTRSYIFWVFGWFFFSPDKAC